MKKFIALLLVMGLVVSAGIIWATESVIILDDPELKAYVATEYHLEGTVPLGTSVKVNGADVEMFRRFESVVPLNPAPSYTHIKVEAFDEDNNIIENQTLHIENYYKTEVVFTLDKNTMLINGDEIEIDAPARKSGIYLYVPFDDVCKAFYGKGSTWDEETQTETFSGGGYDVSIPFDSKYYYVNGEKKKLFQHRPFRVDNKTFVPHWFPEDALDCTRPWSNDKNTVEYVKEFHPEKDFEVSEENENSVIDFDGFRTSLISEPELGIKGEIPDKTIIMVDGKDLELIQKFRTTVSLKNEPTMTPVRIEAFGKDGKILETKEEMINGFDGIYIKLWLGKSEMQVKREMVPIDVPPQIVYDRTMVPIRAIADGFDAETTWINETKTIIIEFGSTRILLPLGSKISTVNGQDVTLDVAAQVINGRALVPIRFIIEAFDAEITWFAAERSIEIRK